MNQNLINFRCGDDTKAELTELSAARRISRAAVLRTLIREAVEGDRRMARLAARMQREAPKKRSKEKS